MEVCPAQMNESSMPHPARSKHRGRNQIQWAKTAKKRQMRNVTQLRTVLFFKKTGTGEYLSGVGVGRRYTCPNLALIFFCTFHR